MQADDVIAVQLTVGDWNQVLAMLAEGPFRIVAPLITKIREQALKQGNGAAPQDAEGRIHVPN
jgi:hypothetical protein